MDEKKYELLRRQLELSMNNGSYEYIEASTNKPISETLKEIEEAQLILTANSELKRRNTFLFQSLIGLGLVCISLLTSCTIMFFRGAPDCNLHRFNTNNQGQQCYGIKCFK